MRRGGWIVVGTALALLGAPAISPGQMRVPSASPRRDLIERLATQVDDALKSRSTLLVWVFDRSVNSQTLRSAVVAGWGDIYKIRETSGDKKTAAPPNTLYTAVVAYDKDAAILVREPTDSYAAAWEAVDGIQDTGRATSQTFAALKQAVDEYLPYRTKHPWHVMFIIVSSRPPDDAGPSEELIARLRTSAVPVYVFGQTVPFSTQNALGLAGKRQGPVPQRLSDCAQWDRIELAYASGVTDGDLTDSGFGPFALGRLCHETGGEFFGVQPLIGQAKAEFTPHYLARYAPDYVSEAKYHEVLAANKCRQALIDAAALPPTDVLRDSSVQRRFLKRDQAQLSNLLGQAQRAAAQIEPQIDRLYDILAAAEPERTQLTGARWQAGYDLAMGRALAAKARCDGYNAMLALVKQGKAFTKSASTTWVLEPAEMTTASSALEGMGKRARQYLERVVQEHPGTPWAESASRELKIPMGWRWDER